MADSRPLLLEVEHLCKWFPLKRTAGDVLQRKEKRYLKAVNDVSFQLFKGENLGLVGESGCGKSTLARTILRLYEPTSGTIRLNGTDISHMKGDALRRLRPQMQMIFQAPAASLDPRQSVGKSIEEVYVINTDYPAPVRREKTMELLERVGLKREHYYSYPHALSGGQKQRVGIARAIALDTRFVVLDESVSALDVSVQAQILQLLNELSREKHLTYFFITHDLGVVKHFCDRILVMYLGNVCELAESSVLFHKPLHPYTESLLAAVPRLKVGQEHSTEFVLEGDVPSAMTPPKGCPFHTRCSKCMEICTREKPPVVEQEPGHFVACHLYEKKKEETEA